MERKKVIETSELSKSFKEKVALKRIDIEVYEGEIFGFLGPSGSGKTTTIKLLTGQLVPTSGRATVLDKPIDKLNQTIYEEVGIVTDNSGLYERLTVHQNLTAFADILDVNKARIDELLTKVGLLEEKKKTVSKLSKGMKQRLILARALLHEPRVLFLDEPTSGLDPTTAKKIHELLLEVKEKGTAIFLTTHNMEEATKLCDRVALLNEGNIVELGSPEEVCLKYNEDKKYRILLKNHQLVILQQSEETTAKIHEWLMNDDIVTIHSCEPTLEQVFIRVTGRKLV